MKIVQKNWVFDNVADNVYRALEELNEYEFEGQVDFCFAPLFYYDVENRIVVNASSIGAEPPKLVILDKSEIREVVDVVTKSSEQVILSRNYGLQDFFNDHANAKCIVFFLSTGYTIFHEGYRIRVYIDE